MNTTKWEKLHGDIRTYGLKVPNAIKGCASGDKQMKEIMELGCNGCGTTAFRVPSGFAGVSIHSACQLHDLSWLGSRDYQSLRVANADFNHNMKLLCDVDGNFLVKYFRKVCIFTYTQAVSIIGTPIYAYKTGLFK